MTKQITLTDRLIETLPSRITFNYVEQNINTSIEVFNLNSDSEHLVLIFYQKADLKRYYLGTVVLYKHTYQITDDISTEFSLEDVYLQFENEFIGG